MIIVILLNKRSLHYGRDDVFTIYLSLSLKDMLHL